MKYFIALLLQMSLLFFHSAHSVAVESNEAAIFKKMMIENVPGDFFKKTSYLAFDGSNSGEKSYKGAESSVKIYVDVDGKGIILYTNIQIEKNIYLNILPELENQYGEYISKKNQSSTWLSTKALASVNGIKLSTATESGLYDYKKGKVSARLEFTNQPKEINGKKYYTPNTTYSASLEK